MERKVYEAIKNASDGLTSNDLLDLLYGDDPDGGPLCARNLVHEKIMRLNKKLKKIGRVIRNTNPRGGKGAAGRYKLLNLPNVVAFDSASAA